MITSPSDRQVRFGWRCAIGVAVILLLSLLYLLQLTIARGYQGERASMELFLRAFFEWSMWVVLLPAVLWLANAVPVGPGRPRRNLILLCVGGVLVMPVWSMLVAAPISGLGLSLWGFRAAAGFWETAERALFQRGPYLAIIYGLIVGLATARRLTEERQAAATRIVELRRELASADLAQFARSMDSGGVVERLQQVEQATERSPDEAEAMTLALADDLHAALVRSRDLLHR